MDIRTKRKRYSFDSGWMFFKGDIDITDVNKLSHDEWLNINIPHDWSIDGPFDKDNPAGGDGAYLPAGTGWYKKYFYIQNRRQGKKIWLEFDGIYMNSDVWINGVHLGNEPYGYTNFYYDITSYVNYGEKENVVVVKVDNSKQPNSRWYSGSGIYRHTWLSYLDYLHIDYCGIFAYCTNISEFEADVNVKATLVNEYDKVVDLKFESYILNQNGIIVAQTSSSTLMQLKSNTELKQVLKVQDPKLWSLDEPYMYKLVTEVKYEDTIVDSCTTNLGIREIEFDSDKGFLLNNKKIKLNGVCIHHDGGCVGAAVPERVLERRLELLKDMGCNAIRMSHNPPSPELLDMCDKMGFLVMDEAFDEWNISKNKNERNEYGYHEYFKEHSERHLLNMLRRDRNHPSIVLWSVGNEIPEQKEKGGEEILKRLVQVCHDEDPTRMVTSACDNIKSEPCEATEEFLSSLDVVGYNYVARWRNRTETFYADDHHRQPEWRIIGSENPSICTIRGEYSFDKSKTMWWQGPYNTTMINAEQLWKFTKSHDYVSGDFMWTGIDYLGESRWPHKSSSCGVIDMCGFPKDSYYFYKSQWTNKPMVHLFPHWNWRGYEGKVIPVLCYTNCDSVELFLNGKSFGIKSYEFPRQGMSKDYGHFDKPYLCTTTSDLHLSWDVPYEPGTLKAVGKKDGKTVCEQVIETTEPPAAIQLLSDRVKINADGADVCNITVRVVDGKGRLVPDADNLINFEIKGKGQIIGVDNGKPDSIESFKANYRKAFNGLALVVVQAGIESGEISLRAEADGLEAAKVIIEAEEIK
ncbi:glycoside hydrolase family 2 TIM barrel-domain containing protein [Clostridium oryzae]|uniref:Beta-galactosidase BoGH2A n=1 Tax=Clostridium oryzae TaxID=1450648 RepID=A0A1V4IPL4_9CLOT|nr:glycoside hydrolase family 2 TIM barrel-domain containing protein [Clostridium oryzae]OPJ61948.1 beta-galactosidase BoGH2A precursor [Clostridium oryzae]